ncbi:MAG: hypothetical protein ACD_20C00239G0001, partial [uncultured bacterium]
GKKVVLTNGHTIISEIDSEKTISCLNSSVAKVK